MDRYLLGTILVNAVWLKSNLPLAHKIKKLVENGVNEVTFGYTTKTRDIHGGSLVCHDGICI